MWTSWVEDLLTVNPTEGITTNKATVMKHFQLDQPGKLSEYIGCKVDFNRDKSLLRFMQPVIIQSFKEEFDLTAHTTPKIPAVPGEVLEEGEEEHCLSAREHWDYQKDMGKLLHATKFTKPDISKTTRKLA